jgi:hypothetical protein
MEPLSWSFLNPTPEQTSQMNQLNYFITINTANNKINEINKTNTTKNYDRAVILKNTYPSINLDYFIQEKNMVINNLIEDNNLLDLDIQANNQLQNFINNRDPSLVIIPSGTRIIRPIISIMSDINIIPPAPTPEQILQLNQLDQYIAINTLNLETNETNKTNTSLNYDTVVAINRIRKTFKLDYFLQQKNLAINNSIQDKTLLNLDLEAKNMLQNFINNKDPSLVIISPGTRVKREVIVIMPYFDPRKMDSVISDKLIRPGPTPGPTRGSTESFTNIESNRINKYDNNSNIIYYILLILIILFFYLKYYKN